jgi:ankyrin repeat protein
MKGMKRERESEDASERPQKKSKSSLPPLHQACRNSDIKEVRSLLKEGADVNEKVPDTNSRYKTTYEGKRPIHFVTNLKIMKILLEEKANINYGDQEGDTPLHYACGESDYNMIKLLIECRAKVNVPNKYGWTPLLAACAHGTMENVHLLLKKRASINKTDNEGWSPLHAACEAGHKSIVELLLKHGANMHLIAYSNETPLFIAKTWDHPAVEMMLIENGAIG